MDLAELLLLAIVALLAAIALRMFRTQNGAAINLGDMIAKLQEAAAHYGDVNAVAELTKQLENDPELMRNLARYPRQVVAAALTHRINSIACDLKRVESELSRARDDLAKYGSLYQHDVTRLEEMEEHLLDLLREANAVAVDFNGLGALA